MKVLIGQFLSFEQEAETIDRVFEIGLRGRFVALLQLVEVVFYLFRIEFCGQALEVECHRGDVPAIVVEGSGASAEDRNIALKTLEQCLEATNFTAGTVEVLVVP